MSNQGNRASARERDRVIGEYLADKLTSQTGRILDLGCGSTTRLAGLEDFQRTGVDLLIERLQDDDHLMKGGLVNADGCLLPFPDRAFDGVLLFTTISSVLDQNARERIGGEVQRVLRAGGMAVVYDMRYPSPGNTQMRPVTERELKRTYAAFDCEFRRLTLIPPLARRLGRTTNRLYPTLAAIPLLRSHIVGIFVKR